MESTRNDVAVVWHYRQYQPTGAPLLGLSLFFDHQESVSGESSDNNATKPRRPLDWPSKLS